jgi:short-subunit dehydrogenase
VTESRATARTAWITGGGSGIGRAVALQLAEQGWRVVVSGRDPGRLEQTRRAAADPESIVVLALDVTDRERLQTKVDELCKEHGVPDVAILNAGDYRPMGLDDFDLDLIHHLTQVNYLGVIKCVDALLPMMRSVARGQILLTASLSAYRGLPRAAPYGATKAALINFAESLRNELLAQGIRLRVINPGFVRSALTDKNDFKMPFLLEPEQAARHIVRGLDRGGFEIAFPLPFVLMLKLLRWLPYRLYFPLTRRMQA